MIGKLKGLINLEIQATKVFFDQKVKLWKINKLNIGLKKTTNEFLENKMFKENFICKNGQTNEKTEWGNCHA